MRTGEKKEEDEENKLKGEERREQYAEMKGHIFVSIRLIDRKI